MATAASGKRVLALHGYSQNSSIFSKRLGALRKECKDIQFVFVDAPHILLPAEFDTPSEELLALQSDPDTAMRGWWTANEERTKITGLQESLLVVRNILKNQRFDGIFGFSQGGAFAALISALLERPNIHPPFLVDGQTPHPPFRFCVAVSGFKVMDPICDPFYSPSLATRTLHVIGRTDVVVIEERSRQLVEVSTNKRVEEHDGGHFVPSKGAWRKFLVAFMRDPTGAHPSPSRNFNGLPESGPSSGAATPSNEFGMDYRHAVINRLV